MHRALLVACAVLALPGVLAAVAPPGNATQGPDQADGAVEEEGEPRTLWNTFLFDSWSWSPGGDVGFGGVALWALLILVLCCIGFAAPLRPTVLLFLASAAFIVAWSLLPVLGPMTEIGLPALAGLAVAWFAVKQSRSTFDVLRLALVATILGAFAGDVLAYGLRHLWTDPGALVFGNRRFVDEIFTLPGFAVAGVVLFKVIPDFVHAMEDGHQEQAPAAEGPGQGDVFVVTCLRCHTEIKVDRSMKRFRVATDRFEFPCPNCQYWMEWADPRQKQGAAAA